MECKIISDLKGTKREGWNIIEIISKTFFIYKLKWGEVIFLNFKTVREMVNFTK